MKRILRGAVVVMGTALFVPGLLAEIMAQLCWAWLRALDRLYVRLEEE